MHLPRRSSSRRSLAAAAVLAAHLMLALLLMRSVGSDQRDSPPDLSQRSVLVWLEEAAPPPSEIPLPSGSLQAAARPTANRNRPRRERPVRAAANIAAQPAGRTGTDWYGAMADDGGSSAPATAPRTFGQMPGPDVAPCSKPPAFEWKPEPKRAGLAGGLPYVRLGRCIVGLGFFGCRVGEPPPANGKLLEGMRDAPPTNSSVPDGTPCRR